MSLRTVVAASVVALLVLACGGPRETSTDDGTWVGTITTEGNVTTVINESGSVWGGTARLVEEASIGVESGREEYLLDAVSFVWADDRRIYVPNPRIPVVRMYDHQGFFLGNLGGAGQGPGEYRTPVMVAAGADGRVFAFDTDSRRINVYSHDGESVATWPVSKPGCCAWPMATSVGDMLWMPIREWAYESETGEERYGVQAFGPDGSAGEVLWAPVNEYPRLTYRVGDVDWEGVPFAPGFRWAPAPGGLVAGVTHHYRFELRRGDGSVTVASRDWERVPVEPDEATWRVRWRVAATRERYPDWNWNGDEVPSHKPAFNLLIPAASGEVWVVRSGPSRRQDNGVEDPLDDWSRARENPCWREVKVLDVFGADGRYLGDVQIPDGLRPDLGTLFVRGDLVLGVIQDEAGTIMVKRYRLALPGEERE